MHRHSLGGDSEGEASLLLAHGSGIAFRVDFTRTVLFLRVKINHHISISGSTLELLRDFIEKRLKKDLHL